MVVSVHLPTLSLSFGNPFCAFFQILLRAPLFVAVRLVVGTTLLFRFTARYPLRVFVHVFFPWSSSLLSWWYPSQLGRKMHPCRPSKKTSVYTIVNTQPGAGLSFSFCRKSRFRSQYPTVFLPCAQQYCSGVFLAAFFSRTTERAYTAVSASSSPSTPLASAVHTLKESPPFSSPVGYRFHLFLAP